MANNVGIIPPYSKESFPKLENNSSDEEDGEVKKADITFILVKIDREGNKSKTNLTKFDVPKLRHFDNNVEKALEGFNLFDTKVMSHLVGLTKEETINHHMQYIEMICFDNAQQDYNEAIKYSKREVLLDYPTKMVQENNANNNDCTMFKIDDNEHVQLTSSNNAAFMEWMNKPADQINAIEVAHMGWVTAAKTRLIKWRHFEIHFHNHLNVIIF